MLGFSYFVTFVDDCSRMTWLFLMKERYDISSIFQLFHKEILTQFGSNIRILQFDNALAYVKGPLQSYYDSQGIIHQSSCGYTPQQNGVTVHKNRHLLKVARTLMMHIHVPK